ncbi:MAG: T9SS type A sorting domain-containing protein [Bacteroidetes bacterium]|nr:T9SS type A sorting domain-containing protein [Bacteroidota bacterium]
MKRYLFLIVGLLLWSICATAQSFKIDTIQYMGDTSRFINVVFLGDGYTAGQQAAFRSQADSVFKYFMARSPYAQYKNYFNAFAVEVVSEESGVKHPHTASDCGSASPQVPITNPKNYFGTTFDGYGIHRLVVPDSVPKIDSVLATHFPTYDLAIVLANSPYYGGSGGSSHLGGTGYPYIISTTYSANYEIALHESGHSFAGLMDEYWVGSQYLFERPNMSQEKNPALSKWKNWIGTNGIGLFRFSQDTNWVKPTNNTCRMEVLSKPFCSVCSEAIIERVHSLTNSILSFSPDTTTHSFSDTIITLRLDSFITPIPNTLKRNWSFNGNTVATNVDFFQISQDTLAPGSYSVVATVIDTTSLVRTELHAQSHIYLVEWKIEVIIIGVQITASTNTISCTVFPNPASDVIDIELETQHDISLQVDLITMDGKLLRRLVDEQTGTGICHQTFNISDLPAGTFLLLFNAGGTRFTKTVIKN